MQEEQIVEAPETKIHSSGEIAMWIIEKMRTLGAKKSTLQQTKEVLAYLRGAFYREWKEEFVRVAKERETQQELKPEEVVHGETIINQ